MKSQMINPEADRYEAFNTDKAIQLNQALIKDAREKVFLILDNLRVHHSKPVKAWAAERQDTIDSSTCPATAGTES